MCQEIQTWFNISRPGINKCWHYSPVIFPHCYIYITPAVFSYRRRNKIRRFWTQQYMMRKPNGTHQSWCKWQPSDLLPADCHPLVASSASHPAFSLVRFSASCGIPVSPDNITEIKIPASFPIHGMSNLNHLYDSPHFWGCSTQGFVSVQAKRPSSRPHRPETIHSPLLKHHRHPTVKHLSSATDLQ